MRKLFIAFQWLIVAALAAFIMYVVMRPTPQPDYTPEQWRNWKGISVISYPGIARKTSTVYPSVKQLESHLTALKKAGYQSVYPEDLRAYLDQQQPLPDKALLIIFEGGRKEAFIRATPILQRTGFSAVLTVPTAVMQKWGNFYLRKKDIAKIDDIPQWSIGSMGHDAVTTSAGSTPEPERRFLTRRLTEKGEVEAPETYRRRIENDYAQSAQLLNAASAKPVSLYLYPYADAGQSSTADPLAEAVNREAVTRYFKLAFINSSHAFNGPGSDPWSLTRLRVPGNWTPEQLLKELSASQPRTNAVTTISNTTDWFFDGDTVLRDATLRLASDAAVWLRGTENWSDCEIKATLLPEKDGISSLYARASSPRSWLRVTATSEEVALQERIGDRLITLYRQNIQTDSPTGVKIGLRLRNNRAWVWAGGHQIAANLPVAPETRFGRIGLGSQQGATIASDFNAHPMSTQWLMTESIEAMTDVGIEQIQAIVPRWFQADTEPAISKEAEKTLLYSSVRGIHTYPLLSGGANLNRKDGATWIAAIDTLLQKRDLKMLLSTVVIEGALPEIAAELRNRGYRVLHLLTPAEAVQWGAFIAGNNSNEIIIVDDTGIETERVLDELLRVVPATRLAKRKSTGNAIAPEIETIHLLNSVSGK